MYHHLLAAAPAPAVTSDGKGVLGALIAFAVFMVIVRILGALLRIAK